MESRRIAGRYQVSRELARGGMGVVYEALDGATGRRVAVKVMLADLVADGDATARFVREARACARLDHPHVVPVLDAGSERGSAYLVMGFLEGDTLQDRIRLEQQLQSRTAVEIAISLAKVLEYVHSQGILHRDIKPENVILTAHGPVVTDFGIAFDGKSEQERLTQSGTMLGTPAYMPPEQVSGERSRVDARVDVYALGATLFAMLSGRPPFSGSSVVNLIRAVLMDPPPKLASLVPVEPELEAIVQRALGKEPEDRYATAREFREALESFLLRREAPPKPRRVLVAAIGLLALSILSAALLLSGKLGAPSPGPTQTSLSPPRSSPLSSQIPLGEPPSEVLAPLREDLEQRRWAALASKLPTLVTNYPRSAQALCLSGEVELRAYFFRGGAQRLRAAQRFLERALGIDPHDVRALALVTKVRSRLAGDCASSARRAFELGEGREAMAHVAQADLLQDQRRADPGLSAANLKVELQLLNHALELSPSSWWAHTDLVARYTTAGQHERAEQAVQAGLLRLPNEPYLFFRRGFNFKMRGEKERDLALVDQALEAYNAAARLGGADFPALLLERGYAHHLRSVFQGGDQAHYGQAVLDLKSAIQSDPQPHAYNVLGVVHRTHMHHREALQAFEGCVALDKTHFAAWASVAMLRKGLSDLPGALAAAEHALEACPPGHPARESLVALKRRLAAEPR